MNITVTHQESIEPNSLPGRHTFGLDLRNGFCKTSTKARTVWMAVGSSVGRWNGRQRKSASQELHLALKKEPGITIISRSTVYSSIHWNYIVVVTAVIYCLFTISVDPLGLGYVILRVCFPERSIHSPWRLPPEPPNPPKEHDLCERNRPRTQIPWANGRSYSAHNNSSPWISAVQLFVYSLHLERDPVIACWHAKSFHWRELLPYWVPFVPSVGPNPTNYPKRLAGVPVVWTRCGW